MTNADKIRSLNDEELVEAITHLISCSFSKRISSEDFKKLDLSKDEAIISEWLKEKYIDYVWFMDSIFPFYYPEIYQNLKIDRK